MMSGVVFFVFIMFGVCRASWISDLISLYSLGLILSQYHFRHCFCPNLTLLSSFPFTYTHPGSFHHVSYGSYALLFFYSFFSLCFSLDDSYWPILQSSLISYFQSAIKLIYLIHFIYCIFHFQHFHLGPFSIHPILFVKFSTTFLNILMTALLKFISNYFNSWITCCCFHH